MNKKVNSPSASWLFAGKNKISRGKFNFLDTDSESAIFQKNLAQRRDDEHLVKAHAITKTMTWKMRQKSSNEVLMKCESREKRTVLKLIYYFYVILNMYMQLKYCKYYKSLKVYVFKLN